MSLALTEHSPAQPAPQPAWARRMQPWQPPPHALWLGPAGLWDFGPLPGWRLGRWLGRWGGSGGPHESAAPQPAHHAGFDAWCQSHPGHGATLVLSAWLLHELLLQPQLPLADDAASLHYARALLQHYHGEAAAQWPLTAWRAAGRRGVSALHGLNLQALQASARQSGVALRQVRPWWSMALALAVQQAPPLASVDSARLLLVDGSLVTLLTLARGRLAQLQQRRLADASPAALQGLHAALPSVAWAGVMGHGLVSPWLADAGDGGLVALGPLHGNAPVALWHGA